MEPHRDQPHLPGPSIYPVGFAIGIVCVLVGIIVSWIIAGVGAAIAIVFAFLWVRDLATARGLTAAPAAEPETAPEGRSEEPPPPEEPEFGTTERFPRSVFLEMSTLGLGAVIGGIVTVPALGFMVLPSFVDQGVPDVDLGPLDKFPESEFVVATFMRDPSQGDVTRRTAFVRNNGLLNGQPSFTILSSRCVHLGCPTQPNGLLQEKQATDTNGVRLIPIVGTSGFGCPCHGGAYDKEGNRVAGPPVRSMDRYAYSIKDGHLLLLKTFSVAKVVGTGKDARIKKYKIQSPGEQVNGIESWLYPIQPPR
jgi:Rieske Fe-S protein